MTRRKNILSDGSWYPKIPDLCHCGCNEIIWYRERMFKRGHNNKTKEGKNNLSKININRIFSLEHRKNLGVSQIGNKKALGHKLEGKSKERSSRTFFKKGQHPWNENTHGLMPHGENHPLYGIPISEERKKKQRQAMSGSKNPRFGKPRSESTKEKLRISNGGNNHWNWQGGKNVARRKRELKLKLRGWYSLNPIIGDGSKKIKGYIRHHVNFNDIIYVPREYIENITHNLFTGFNMEIANTIAYFFLVMNNIDNLNLLFIL